MRINLDRFTPISNTGGKMYIPLNISRYDDKDEQIWSKGWYSNDGQRHTLSETFLNYQELNQVIPKELML